MHFSNIKGCRHCAVGEGTCSPDNPNALECENLLRTTCKDNGVAVPLEQLKANGCKSCSKFRSICASSCNYCNVQKEMSSTPKKLKAGIN